MVAHLTCMRGEPGRPLLLVRRLERLEVRSERHLGVHDHLLAARDAYDEVGPQEVPLGVPRRRLGDEVAVLQHSRELDDVPELRLAPPAAHRRRAQRVREAPRPLAEDGDLLPQRAVGLLAGAIELLHAEANVLERLPERRDGRLQLAARRVEVSGAAVPERLGRRRPHGLGQARVERALGRLEPRVRPREVALQLEHALAPRAALGERRTQEEQDAQGADEETDEECHDRHEGTGP